MTTLIRAFGGLIHARGCYTIAHLKPRPDMNGRDSMPYTVVAPEIERAEVVDFCRARNLTPCGGCLRKERDQLAAEREAVAYG